MSTTPLPFYLRADPLTLGERLRRWGQSLSRWIAGRQTPDAVVASPDAAAPQSASARHDAVPVAARVHDDAPRTLGETCPRSERAFFGLAIVAIHALMAGLGLSPAALPLIVGGVGAALMLAWIGWYWPDEA